ncbi:class I SAM-dependent methyltransferase [Pleionea sediminis]|uniref:class I SAM-dependent methyltransferase n=1 Tax=Pleionea sediminis TaxID=2569479 RepID=UPI001186A6EB|nr:class I SAM-dependent methyltransferase [Pleionea sediminis]
MLKVLRNKFTSSNKKSRYGKSDGEKSADWYDESFERADHWKSHYTESKYYFIWTVICDRLVRQKKQSVLEVGCGPGQLASFIADKGIKHYHGFDFSPKRIEQAEKVTPQFNFSVEDAFKTDLFTTVEYDCVVCTEFLEHVEGDLEVLDRIRSGTYFIGTVPNFPYTSHVRHFNSVEEVYERYKDKFENLTVDAFNKNKQGKVFYILDGIIK